MTATDTYHLGVDIGTTFTAAALNRGGGVELAIFGHSDVVVPSVLHYGPDGSWLVGAAAVRRATGRARADRP
ncbi:MAG: Hsp70 family protein [Acidimicrobiales bacterium]